MGRVAVLGSLNVDVVTRVERHPQPGETLLGEPAGRFAGGKGGNQAMAARRAGAEVVMIGRVGADDAGAAYVDRLRRHGIQVEVPTADDAPTGTAFITVDDAGENAIVVVPGANHGAGGAFTIRKRNDWFVKSLLGIDPPNWNSVELPTSTGGLESDEPDYFELERAPFVDDMAWTRDR